MDTAEGSCDQAECSRAKGACITCANDIHAAACTCEHEQLQDALSSSAGPCATHMLLLDTSLVYCFTGKGQGSANCMCLHDVQRAVQFPVETLPMLQFQCCTSWKDHMLLHEDWPMYQLFASGVLVESKDFLPFLFTIWKDAWDFHGSCLSLHHLHGCLGQVLRMHRTSRH